MDKRPQSSWRSLFTFFFVTFVSFLLLVYAGPFKNPSLNPHALATERDLHDNAVVNLTKRVTTYEAARERGAKLHCLMAMSEEDAQAANKGVSLESPEYLQSWGIEDEEGWDTDGEDKDAPYFRNYLDAAFSGLGITKKLVTMFWAHINTVHLWDDPFDIGEGDMIEGFPSGAFFTNSFILDPGVVIADNNFAVKPAIDKEYGNWEGMMPTTYIRQWSDGVWMQWIKACTYNGGDVTKMEYIIRSRITNKNTLSIVFQALLDKFGGNPTISKWDDCLILDVEKDPDEFHAVLGSPNGAGLAYLLLNHKGKLGIRTINKVDIFIPNIPYTVTGTSVGEIEKGVKVMLLFSVSTV